MEVAISAFVGALIAWAVAYFAPGAWSRLIRRPSVYVHVEKDPAIFYAGGPNWDASLFVLLDLADPSDVGEPPRGPCRDWRSWLWPIGAYDAERTDLHVTIQGAADSTVLIDGLRVTSISRRPVSGFCLLCPVGGADATPRSVNVDLDWDPGVVTYSDAGGEPTGRFAFTLTKGEVETFHIVATAGQAACSWVAELFLVVNGRREVVQIDDDGDPFRTSGVGSIPTFVWSGSDWRRPGE